MKKTKIKQITSSKHSKSIINDATIRKVIEENPDLSYEFIKGILIAKEEVRMGKLTLYIFKS